MDDMSRDYHGLPGCNDSRKIMWRHQRSRKRFLLIASDKNLQERAWCHCVQLIRTQSRIEWIIYMLILMSWVSWPEVNLWPWPDEVIIYISMLIDDRVLMFCYFWSSMASSKVIGKKSFLVLKCRYFDLFTPVTSVFTWPKMIFVKIVDFVRLYRMPFTACL